VRAAVAAPRRPHRGPGPAPCQPRHPGAVADPQGVRHLGAAPGRRRARGQRRGAARARRGRPRAPVEQLGLGPGGRAGAQVGRTAADRHRRGQGVPDVSIPRLTVRARLTLLYTGLFVACGALVVAVTYALVASLQNPPARPGPACPQPDQALRTRCKDAFHEAAALGARIQQEATLPHLLQYSLITLSAATLLAAAAGWIVAGRVLRPVQQITQAAQTASEHNLAARISLRGPRDELRELADTFDAMLARLQAAFESQRRFVANAGHELRTPLTVMRTTLDVVLAKPDPAPGELHRMGQDVRAAVDDAERLIGALLTLARSDRGLTVCEPVDLA